jgi:ribosomal-protein-serine acetyltransferase
MFAMPVGDGVQLALPLESDADALFALVDTDRERLGAWLPWVARTRTAEDERAFVREARAGVASGREYLSVVFAGGEVAGTIGLHLDRLGTSAEIGYWLGAAYEGRGVMTRATRAVCERAFARLLLHRLEIRTAPNNARSRAIPQRLGFVRESIQRQAERTPEGGYRDLELWVMLAADWPATPRRGD